ncbi:GNAT family N-acetyltransferase [Paucilactobacillus vaccinostercus]|uniref:GNAT family N-acetyltransferase n=1 Tax=Paucilactobacillus vaccinostercus TaxID=176291 RepID=UPI00070A776D|nr:GNAT family N-acetyltransferase [Paucilactobacillus vaccinostercus]
MITLTPVGNQRAYWTQIYEDSFPAAEQMRTDKLYMLSDDPSSRAHAALIQQNQTNIGIVYYVVSVDDSKAFILYLAVDPDRRGDGLGSQAISYLTQRFMNGIILESEVLDVHANNRTDRQRRYDFYLRNGLMDSGYLSDTLGGVFHLLRSSQQVSLEDYFDFLAALGLRSRVSVKEEG